MRHALIFVAVVLSGCSLKTIALRSLADSLAEPGSVYARDSDPELVRDSLPVMLKIMEQLHDGLPSHVGIRLALVRSFTSYGVAFIEEEADRLAESNMAESKRVYARARALLLRAYAYGTEGLDLVVPGLKSALDKGNSEAQKPLLAKLKKEDVPLVFWTAAALGSAVSCAKDDMRLMGQLPIVDRLMARALELDESYDEGAIHEFYVAYDASRSEAQGGGPKRAREHLLRARALSKNRKLSPLVSFAEGVAVAAQDKHEFTHLLEEVVSTDIDRDLEHRLVNEIAKRRARWLLSRTTDLFAE